MQSCEIVFEDPKKFKKQIKKLYRSAFPADERAPLFLLYRKSKREINSFYAVTAENEFAGFAYTIRGERAVYVFFLAVKEELRGRGYGSSVLAKIKKLYPELTVILMIEDTADTSAKNYDERIERLDFYRKNGFNRLNVQINEAGVEYELLGTDSNAGEEDFYSIMKSFLGSVLFKLIYRKSNFS